MKPLATFRPVWLGRRVASSMAARTNLAAWLEEYGPSLKPPVANKLLYGDHSALKVMVVGGPNQRSDFHLQAGEEYFVQLEGELVLKVVEGGKFRDVAVPAGSSFLLPSHVPHSPQRSTGSVGLVFERSHTPQEMDGMLWFNSDLVDGAKADSVVFEEYFHCTDLGSQLKPIIERYRAWHAKGGASRVTVENPPIVADRTKRLDAPKRFDVDILPTSTLVDRGEEVIVNLYVGPSVLQAEAAPFDIFAWQRRGTSTCRKDDGREDVFQPGDVALVPKATGYEWSLEPGAALLTVANVFT